jgi:hypothetical protein
MRSPPGGQGDPKPMNGDLLLYWMSRLGTGSWQRFANTIQELAPDEDQDVLRRRLPGHLSDLGHVDFSRATRKWKARPPVLAGLAGQPQTALLCGARSEPLIASLQQAARGQLCDVVVQPEPDFPSRITVATDVDRLNGLQKETGIPFFADYSLRLLANVPPISKRLTVVQPERGVLNWEVKIFDFQTLRWQLFTQRLARSDALPKLAALELTSQYETKYCVTDRYSIPRKLPKREAIYAAAAFQHHALIHYHAADRFLSTPIAAPMPEVYTRIACLSSGNPARLQDGRLVYDNVPPIVAATLAVLAGQPHPRFPIQ